ncbi:MAG TPA: hypothetical protein DDZ78_13730 [Porphyromonadaceae bacterium]|nr:hypothetical protein [Porphyromonadaceae bacterium]
MPPPFGIFSKPNITDRLKKIEKQQINMKLSGIEPFTAFIQKDKLGTIPPDKKKNRQQKQETVSV